jgi:subtilisin family serine protease
MTEYHEAKVSPAFQPFLADSAPEVKRDAIVVYKAPALEGLPVRGRLRVLKQRLDSIKAQAAAQREIQARLEAGYRKEGARRMDVKQPLSVAPIGSSALPVAAVEVTRKTLPALAERPEVVAILPNQQIHLIRPKAVEYSKLARQEVKNGLTWGLKQLDITRVWAATKGEDINVAVLDTGVHGEHPALTGRIKKFVLIDPLGRRIEASPTFDAGRHGTHVCGTLAGGKTPEGVAIGVAPGASLLVAGVLLGDATVRTLLEGLSWAVENGADIVNMSLGFSYYEPLFAEVFAILIDHYGVLPVVAIGNENHGNSSSPGNAYNAFSVGAVEKGPRRRDLEVAAFSSGASLVFPGDQKNALVNKPDVVAPGAQVYSCIPPVKREKGTFEYNYMDGTSMATPHVAGCAALLMAARPEAPVAEIIRALKETAAHPGAAALRPDNRWGFGLVQPVEALAAL